jgi:hypothetical protein
MIFSSKPGVIDGMVGQRMRLGPERKDWIGEEPPGGCPDCGGQCAPECGRHPSGCIYGGPTESSCYWLIADTCTLYHGEAEVG